MSRKIITLLIIVISISSLHAAATAATGKAPPSNKSSAASSAAQTYLRGRKLLETGKAKQALVVLEKAVATGKAPAMAYYYLAKAQEKLGIDDYYETYYKFMDKASPQNPEETAAIRKILEPRMRLLAKGSGTVKDAIAYFAFAKNPVADKSTLEKCLVILSSYARDNQAVDSVKALIKRYPKEELLYRYLSEMYAKGQGDRAEALEFCTKATALFPKDARVWSQLGDLHYRAGRYDQALPAYLKASELKPDDPALKHCLAGTYSGLDKPDDAITFMLPYYESLADNPSRWNTGMQILNLCATPEQLERLREMLDKQLSAGADDHATPLLLAEVLRKQGKESEAQAVESKLVDSAKDIEQMGALAWDMYNWGKLDSATRLYYNILSIKPDQDYSYELVTCALYQNDKGKKQEAFDILRRVLSLTKLQPTFFSYFLSSIQRSGFSGKESTEQFAREEYDQHPESPMRQWFLAGILIDRGKDAEASDVLKKLIFGGNSFSLRDYQMLLDAARRMGKVKELASDFKAAIDQRPSDSELHRVLGIIYEDLGDHSAAIAEFKKTRELLPEDKAVCWFLARAYQKSGQLAEAINEFTSVDEKTQSSGERRMAGKALLDMYRRSGKLAEGIAFFEKLVKAEPDDTDSTEYLADLYISANQPDKAIRVLSDSLTNDTGYSIDPKTLIDVCVKNGKVDQGIAMFRKMLAAHPGDGGTAANLAELLILSNRIDEAARVSTDMHDSMWLVPLSNRVTNGRIMPQTMLAFLAVRPVNNVDVAQIVLRCIKRVFESTAAGRASRSRKTELVAQARKICDDIAAKFPGTVAAAKAEQLAVHCGIGLRIMPEPGKLNQEEGARVVQDLLEVERRYPQTPAALDCALDLLSVYRMLGKTTENDALEARIAAGEYGESAANNLLRSRGFEHCGTWRFKEAVDDLSRYFQNLKKDPAYLPIQPISLPAPFGSPNRERTIDRSGLIEAQIELAKAFYGLGGTEQCRRIVQEVVSMAGRLPDTQPGLAMLGRFMKNGDAGVYLRVNLCRDNTVTIQGDEVKPDSAGDLTQRLYSEVVMQGLRPDTVPVSLRIAVPTTEGMADFPQDGKTVEENGSQTTEWKIDMTPLREDQNEGTSFGCSKTAKDEPQPIKGLNVIRSCVQESPGVWKMELAVTAEENIRVSVILPPEMEFDWEGTSSNEKPLDASKPKPGVSPSFDREMEANSMSWDISGPDDGKNTGSMTATIRMHGTPAGKDLVPEIRISAVEKRLVKPEASEDGKSFRINSQICGFSFSSEKSLFIGELYDYNRRSLVLAGTD